MYTVLFLLQFLATTVVLVRIPTVWSLLVSASLAQTCATLMTMMWQCHWQWQPVIHRDWNITVSVNPIIKCLSTCTMENAFC